MTPTLGTIIAERYRLCAKLGAGGMGTVWRAEHVELGTAIALKLMASEITQVPEALARFKQEAKAAALLGARTRHVVQMLDYGVSDGLPFIAMELLEGEDLAARLQRLGRLEPGELLAIFTQVGAAMLRAHEFGIVHRDLKPANLFITRDRDSGEEVVKVLDFGIAKAPRGVGGTTLLETRTGQILGTPYYMSPEQITGRGVVDQRSDIWALGVIACEALTGVLPFSGETVSQLTLAVCVDPLPVPSRLGPAPPSFNGWFAKATHRNQAKRFSTVEEAVLALRAACAPSTARERLASRSRAGQTAPVGRQPGAAAAGAGPRSGSQPEPPLRSTGAPSSQTLKPGTKARGVVPAAVWVTAGALGVASAAAWGIYAGLRQTGRDTATGVASAAPSAAPDVAGTSASARIPEPSQVPVAAPSAALLPAASGLSATTGGTTQVSGLDASAPGSAAPSEQPPTTPAMTRPVQASGRRTVRRVPTGAASQNPSAAAELARRKGLPPPPSSTTSASPLVNAKGLPAQQPGASPGAHP